ncbi:MAG: TorF family putative porin [Lysobacterales bacterium]
MTIVRKLTLPALTGMLLMAGTAAADDFTANIAIDSNYIWRGLTQTQNEVAVSGGMDYVWDNGFYVGTWISNVSYAPGDVFSYENDVYLGYSFEASGVTYDFGYLYFNYDDEAEFDFAEVYGSVGIGAFTFGLNILAHTEADEAPGQDFGFGETIYAYGDWSTEIREGLELGLHAGYHDGDFNEAFNGVPEGYFEYGISLSKDGFTVKLTGTDLDDAGPDGLDNDEVKFVVGYSKEFDL